MSEGNRQESPADFNFWKMTQSLQVAQQEFLDRLPAPMMLSHDSGDTVCCAVTVLISHVQLLVVGHAAELLSMNWPGGAIILQTPPPEIKRPTAADTPAWIDLFPS